MSSFWRKNRRHPVHKVTVQRVNRIYYKHNIKFFWPVVWGSLIWNVFKNTYYKWHVYCSVIMIKKSNYEDHAHAVMKKYWAEILYSEYFAPNPVKYRAPNWVELGYAGAYNPTILKREIKIWNI